MRATISKSDPLQSEHVPLIKSDLADGGCEGLDAPEALHNASLGFSRERVMLDEVVQLFHAIAPRPPALNHRSEVICPLVVVGDGRAFRGNDM